MATTQLSLYNTALAALGERALDSTAENRMTRRELDKVWDRGNGVRQYAIEQGTWNFATARTTLNSSTSAAFGFANQAALPSDFVRLVQISTGVDMDNPLIRFEIEANQILFETTTVYLRYVSNSTSYGFELNYWPDSFANWVGFYMATQVHPTIENPKVEYRELQARTDLALYNARLKNAAQQPRPFPERTSTSMEPREIDYLLEMATAAGNQQARGR